MVSDRVKNFQMSTYVTVNLTANKSNHYAMQNVSFPLEKDDDKFSLYTIITRIHELKADIGDNRLLFITKKAAVQLEIFFKKVIVYWFWITGVK